jgi:hypothetical protein
MDLQERCHIVYDHGTFFALKLYTTDEMIVHENTAISVLLGYLGSPKRKVKNEENSSTITNNVQ